MSSTRMAPSLSGESINPLLFNSLNFLSMTSLRSMFPAFVGAIALGLTACDGPVSGPTASPKKESPPSRLTLNATSRIAIVTSPRATPAERYAAEELSNTLSRILQRALISDSTDGLVPDAVNFVIGRHPANAPLAPESLKEEESMVKIAGRTVHLVGGQSTKTNKNKEGEEYPAHDRGTLYAVYDFLESLGVRWYRPEPWGEHIPELSEITLEEGEKRTEPTYHYRYGTVSYTHLTLPTICSV